jgi:uncharacterized protein YbjT (DUF2867 family)
VNTPLVLVTGATGKQGGAVSRHLLARGVRVRALTRNADSHAARALAIYGAEIVAGDMNDAASLSRALVGVNTVFAVQDFWAKGVGYEGEVQQGVNLANAALDAGVTHFVQSAMAKADHIEGIAHFQSKQAICKHIGASGLPYTIVGTVYFMDNLLDPKRGGAMSFPTLSGTLHPTTKMHMLAVDDLGAMVAEIILRRDAFLGQHIDIASDCLTISEMRDIYLRTTGLTAKAWKLPAWMLRLFNRDFAKQLAWQNNPGWSFSLDQSKALCPQICSFADFIRKHQIKNL